MSVTETKNLAEAAPASERLTRLGEQVSDLQNRYAGVPPEVLLRAMMTEAFAGRICVVSSFGAEASVLLHMVAEIDPTVPVIFLNTGKLFGETLRYRDRLQTQLGLTDIRSIAPHPADLASTDEQGDLWQTNPDQCCHIRKVLPQQRALKGFDAVITGRKRFQTAARSGMQMIELEADVAVPADPADPSDASDASDKETAERVRLNPLADMDLDMLNSYMETHKLPRHPLVRDGYLSIGCMPCTDKVTKGGDYRSGRWSGQDKEECGIHKPEFVYGDGI